MIYLLLSVGLGAVAVLQGGLNRQITETWGLIGAIGYNAIITLIVVGLFALVVSYLPQHFPSNIAPKLDWSQWQWWYIIPGICGFALITGIPLAIPKVGALTVFLGMVVGQMTTSLVWDYFVESMTLDPKRIVGALLAIAGLIITNWR